LNLQWNESQIYLLRRLIRDSFRTLRRFSQNSEGNGFQFCGRAGFGASKFHGRCDGHANTLTVILDTKWKVFGGFIPLK
jgi:hypothetical protein